MKNFPTLTTVGLAAGICLFFAAPFATARDHGNVSWSITVGTPSYGPPPVVYVQPQPVYVQPEPVYVRPRRFHYVQPAPVVEYHHYYEQPYYGEHRKHKKHWKHHRHDD